MENFDKVSLLKEIEFYSNLLKKHEALKKEKDLKSAIARQTKISCQSSKPKSFHSYKVVKNQNNPASCFNQKYSFIKKPSHLSIADQNKRNGLYNHQQNFNVNYSLSKNQALNNVSSVNKCLLNSKTVNNISSVNGKLISNSKSHCNKIQPLSNGSKEINYNAKDFIKEVETLTKLLKKKTSGTSQKVFNSTPKSENITQNKIFSNKKDQNSASGSVALKIEPVLCMKKDLVQTTSKLPINVNYVHKINFVNSNKQKKVFKVNKSVYKKENMKQPLSKNISSLKKIKNINETKEVSPKSVRSTSRKVIFSDSKKLSCSLRACDRTAVFQVKPLLTDTRECIMKSLTPNKISSNRKVIKKSPHITKMKSPVLKIKSNVVKVPKIMKTKQADSRYTKINKHLTPSNKKLALEHHSLHKSSLRKMKKKVSSKYKVINKTLTPSSNEKNTNSLDMKKSSFSTDCDIFLEGLNNSAVDKLEQNLLVISSELTTSVSTRNKNCTSKIIHPALPKVERKIDMKKIPFKKSKSKISKYKIINSNISQKHSVKNVQSVHTVTPLRRERAVLVRRLFKSKNVLINKNVSPTNYSAKMIKSKYLLLNKRKYPNWQKNVYPTVPQLAKFKGSYFAMKLHHREKRFRVNSASAYPSRLIKKTHYGWDANKYIHKNHQRQIKYKINSRYAHSPVVFIRGTRYAMNSNGKTLKKLPIKGYTAKNFQRISTKLIRRTPEHLNKTSPVSTNLANRALHRSINRILSATSKKKLQKVNMYCMFYNRFGRCNRGIKCTYIHDPSKIAVCTRFLRGTCKIDGCLFSHEIDPGKMAICSFFLVGQCDKENCPYRHEKLLPNAVLCKDFVQGYCHYGKECKKAHILICPKYMQGECNKDSSCAFPHPPQQAKKNIQKEGKNEETKPTDVLLEKVLRYFQQGGNHVDEFEKNSATNLFVPKQGKLEEQPSFIPLTN